MAETIQLFGSIFKGFDPYSGAEALDGAWMADQLKQAGPTTDINLEVNSDGGSVFEAKAMMEAIAMHKGTVTANVVSLAGSSATFLIMAADRVEMAPGSFFVPHQPYGGLQGTAGEFREQADMLDKVRDSTIIPAYQERTGMSRDELMEMMSFGEGNSGQWIEASEAVAMGFADGLSRAPNVPIAAMLRPQFAANAPDGIVAMSRVDYRAKSDAKRSEIRQKQSTTKHDHAKKRRDTARAEHFARIDAYSREYAELRKS